MIVWDGMLPATLWITPIAVQSIVPNQRGPVEVIAVVLPILAFFARAWSGRRSIRLNNCGARMKSIQRLALGTGLLLLVPMDAIIILSHIMPPNAAFATSEDIVVWAVLFLAYVIAMSIAMYPGPAQRRILPISAHGEAISSDNDRRQLHNTD